jgi:hypothetical protein
MKVYLLYTDKYERSHGIYATRKAARKAMKEYKEKYPYSKEHHDDFMIVEEEVITEE